MLWPSARYRTQLESARVGSSVIYLITDEGGLGWLGFLSLRAEGEREGKETAERGKEGVA